MDGCDVPQCCPHTVANLANGYSVHVHVHSTLAILSS